MQSECHRPSHMIVACETLSCSFQLCHQAVLNQPSCVDHAHKYTGGGGGNLAHSRVHSISSHACLMLAAEKTSSPFYFFYGKLVF